jgi:hypothetical protein
MAGYGAPAEEMISAHKIYLGNVKEGDHFETEAWIGGHYLCEDLGLIQLAQDMA